MVQSVRYLETVLSQGIKIIHFLSLTLCLIPLMMFITIPISLFITIFYVYGKLLYNKEIVILYSLGVTKINVIKPFIKFTILIILIHLFISSYLLPLSTIYFKNIKMNINQDSLVNLVRPNTFISKIKNLTIYIQKKGANHLLNNLFIYNSKNPDKETVFIARFGKFYMDQNIYKLILYSGKKIEFFNNKKKYSSMKFSKCILNLPQNQRSQNEVISDSYTLSIPELLSSNINKLKIQGYFRLIWPFSSLSVTLSVLYFLSKDTLITPSYMYPKIYTYIAVSLIVFIHLAFYLLNETIYQYYYVLYCFDFFLPIIILYNFLDQQKIHYNKK